MEYSMIIREQMERIRKDGCAIDPVELESHLISQYADYVTLTGKINVDKEFSLLLRRIKPVN